MLLVNFLDVSQGNLSIEEIKGLVYASKHDMESAINEIEEWADESTIVDDSSILGKEYSIIRTFTVIGTAVKLVNRT